MCPACCASERRRCAGCRVLTPILTPILTPTLFPRSDELLITPWVFFRYVVIGVYVGVATVSGAPCSLAHCLPLVPACASA